MKYFGDFLDPNTITKSHFFIKKILKKSKNIKKSQKIKNKITKIQIL